LTGTCPANLALLGQELYISVEKAYTLLR